MQRLFLLIILFISSNALFSENSEYFKITTKIINSKKAKSFDKNYSLVLPCHDYYNLFSFITPGLYDSIIEKGHDMSYILTNNIYGKNINEIQVKKNIIEKDKRSILSEIWMQPLSEDNRGYMYLDNYKVISKKYNGNSTKEIIIGKDINTNFDRHCMINLGDTLYYFTVADYNRKIKLFGKDTSIIDFDFYEWNSNTNKTIFLFSASNIVVDSMLVPALFESDGIYNNILDIYHWNWLQKVENNKLLINFAFSGFMQVDLTTHKIDWYWCNNSSSFANIKGVGDLSYPYYTHDFNIITSGPYKGYYSYFENGTKGDSVIPFKPARARIFRINPASNSIEIVLEKVFDISTMAMGSINVTDNFVMVNLGMNVPVAEIMQTLNISGKSGAIDFWKKYNHPQIYIYDLKGNEISNYKYPFGFYSYSAWLKKKAKK